MKIELFTVATQTTSGWERFRVSLSKFEVPVTVLGENEPQFRGYGWKWTSFIRAARQSTADTVVFCDGYDSVCLGPLAEIPAKFEELSHPIVFSFARHPQPEHWLSLNSGLVVANREALLSVFPEKILGDLFPDHCNDQFQLQDMYARDPNLFQLDRQSIIFHTLFSGSLELAERNKRLVNPDTGHAPTFAHAPRNGDLRKIEQWLAASN